jgi:ABC-type branched-subunit amino acid transport system ATPase component
MPPVLETKGLIKQFGGITATNDVSLAVDKGARHALIGPNGAGKTTFINLITGRLAASSGRILLGGEDVTALPQEARVKRGLGRTFQINQLFRGLSVLENVCIAIAERLGEGGRMLRAAGRRADVIGEASRVIEMLKLGDDAGRRIGELPYGRQRLVEIAIALGLSPRVLLLDEPAAGVPEAQRRDILDAVAALPDDVTVLLIEHDMDIVFSFADRISVLVNGALFVEGPPEEVAADPRVKAVYLGEEAHA